MIGVLDSGIGGFTVVKEIRRAFPNESIVYTGDSQNCPYGNKSKREIISLTQAMISFLEHRNVSVIVIACNTISSLIGELKSSIPLISIISAVTREVAELNISEVGLIATEFTVASGVYPKLLRSHQPNIRVHAQASPNLAALIESGLLDSEQTYSEIKSLINKIRSVSTPLHVILGCTHYPLVIKAFETIAPEVTFINPATSLVTQIRQASSQDLAPTLTIYTSGEIDTPSTMLHILNIQGFTINKISSY